MLEACDFPLAASRARGKASGAVAGCFANVNGASATSASRAEPSAPLGISRRRGGKSSSPQAQQPLHALRMRPRGGGAVIGTGTTLQRPTMQAATFRAAREAGWTLEAQLDSLDQRIKQQAREAAARAAQDARRQAEKEASQHVPVRRRLSVFGKLKVQAPEAAPVPAPAPAPAPKGIARDLGRRARDNIVNLDNVDDGDPIDGEGRAEARQARQGSLSASEAAAAKEAAAKEAAAAKQAAAEEKAAGAAAAKAKAAEEKASYPYPYPYS